MIWRNVIHIFGGPPDGMSWSTQLRSQWLPSGCLFFWYRDSSESWQSLLNVPQNRIEEMKHYKDLNRVKSDRKWRKEQLSSPSWECLPGGCSDLKTCPYCGHLSFLIKPPMVVLKCPFFILSILHSLSDPRRESRVWSWFLIDFMCDIFETSKLVILHIVDLDIHQLFKKVPSWSSHLPY